jgi:hypothetical protein
MKRRGPQSQARCVHQGYVITTQRVGGRTIGFLISRGGTEFVNGFSNAPVSCRKLARQLMRWLDTELRKIEDFAW